eukprot:6517851-Prymnesium_polylepis.1
MNAAAQWLQSCNGTNRLLASVLAESDAAHACHGRYRASDMRGVDLVPHVAAQLLQSEFVLAIRGDTHTSRRLADAMVHGAIPVLVADEIFEMGIPFQ